MLKVVNIKTCIYNKFTLEILRVKNARLTQLLL